MKASLVLLKILSLFAIFAVALAVPSMTTTTTSSTPTPTPIQCDSGSQPECCQSVQLGSSGVVQTLLELLGVVLKNLNTEVGITCSPITTGSSDVCNASPVCCDDNSFNGIIAIGCTPINID
ncbi:fungal hydrophobin [Schizopora paradoxa]|uniref:Hydrophobin n=1 Tax=Schizopora paradoxa TaxID=27342 RepID=A0A0H2S688_9AGAM|nr:fungal hydrophobin [Schizopora paradoxa]